MVDLRRNYKRHSLQSKVVFIVAATSAILILLAVTISFLLYRDTMNERYVDLCRGVAGMMTQAVDGEQIDDYLETREKDASYEETVQELAVIQSCFSEIKYMYVYQIHEDGCHVVFDLDTEDTPAGALGDVVAFDESFENRLPALLAGERTEPIASHGKYGWLLTVYEPILDANGRCTAYAGVDIQMEDVRADRYIFIIRMLSLLVGATIIITSFSLWFAQRYMVAPINQLARVSGQFAYDTEENRQAAVQRFTDLHINTGDEIENLYAAIKKTVTDVSSYIREINEKTADIQQKAAIIQQMQNNTIVSFASMVESRDLSTGNHVKHTAAYVRLLAEGLRQSGVYAETLSDDYIDTLVRSAPLHDIGKIEISDAILNKPGKLTSDEFETIKTHTTIGRAILQEAFEGIEGENFLAQAEDLAEYHHEKWNGMGYPCGLSGDAIPLCARIMAVADVFDALISSRSYKEPYDFETACAIIRSESGNHFDPQIVEVFVSLADNIRQVSLIQ